MPSDYLTIKGMVLSSDEYKEKDRMITILTAEHGIVKACAKGTASKKSKNAFLSVPYMLCDFTLSDSHGFWYVKDALIIESNSGILSSIEAMAVAAHIAEILSKAVFQSEVSSEAYKLTVYAYYALSTNPDNYGLIYSAFNSNFLMISGLAAPYEDCDECHTEILKSDCSTYYVNLMGYMCLCKNCASANGLTNKLFKMSKASVAALDYFFTKPISQIFTLKCDPLVIEELRRFTTSYLSVQLDEQFEDPIKRLRLPF